MKQELLELKERIERSIQAAQSLAELNQVRVDALGKKGSLTKFLRGLGELPVEERPVWFQRRRA